MEKAYQAYKGFTQKDGSITVDAATNDDRDLGYANDDAFWSFTCADKIEFDKRCGKSRIGVSGVEVIVTLDNKAI